MYLKYYDGKLVEPDTVGPLDGELFSGSFWLGLEQSFYIQDYNTGEVLPRRKSKSIANHLDKKIWESLTVNKVPDHYRILERMIKVEDDHIQYEFNLPLPPLFGNFESVYKILDIAMKILHEEATNKGVLLSSVNFETNDGIYLNDNHVTISHLDIPIINAYNNLRAHIPELLVPSSNSPMSDNTKSERNILVDDLYYYPHVGPRISNYKQYEEYLKKQSPDHDKLLVTTRKLSENQRKQQRTFIEEFERELLWEQLMVENPKRKLPNLQFVSREELSSAPKKVDILIKNKERIEVTLPDGSTCTDDMVFNLVRAMMAAYTPKNSGLPPLLDTYLLQGRKTYSSLTGENYDIANPEEVVSIWNNLDKKYREILLRDPLALFVYFRDKGPLFKVNDYNLYNEKLDEWKVPQRIKNKIKGLSVEENPANTYEGTDEPAYKAFDNLNDNITWIKR